MANHLTLNMEIILDYPGGYSVIRRVLKSERGRPEESVLERCHVRKPWSVVAGFEDGRADSF